MYDNAANPVNQTDCKMGILKILFRISPTSLNILASVMSQYNYLIVQRFFIHKGNNLILVENYDTGFHYKVTHGLLIIIRSLVFSWFRNLRTMNIAR